MKVRCVECGAELYECEGDGVSHGICHTCLEKALLLLKKRKEKRRADNQEPNTREL